MLQNQQQAVSNNVCSDPRKTITEKDIIQLLKGITEQRFNAISAYPSAKTFAESAQLINQMREELNHADDQLNYKSAVKICLRLEAPLLYLAPRSTVKIFTTYKEKVDFLMYACREILNYQKQVA